MLETNEFRGNSDEHSKDNKLFKMDEPKMTKKGSRF